MHAEDGIATPGIKIRKRTRYIGPALLTVGVYGVLDVVASHTPRSSDLTAPSSPIPPHISVSFTLTHPPSHLFFIMVRSLTHGPVQELTHPYSLLHHRRSACSRARSSPSAPNRPRASASSLTRTILPHSRDGCKVHVSYPTTGSSRAICHWSPSESTSTPSTTTTRRLFGVMCGGWSTPLAALNDQ